MYRVFINGMLMEHCNKVKYHGVVRGVAEEVVKVETIFI